jgi:raffinose/stachyose/melibiose transport system permease protein
VTTAPVSNAAGASPAAAPLRQQRGGGPARRYANKGAGLADWIGVGPPMLLFGLFIVVPMIVAIVFSFVSWNGVGSITWAGGSNWVTFFHDPQAHASIVTTVKLVVFSYVVQTPISIALGLFTAGKQRYKAVYAAIFVLPMLISTVGVGLMWQSFLDPTFGPLNGHQAWLSDPNVALYVLTLIIAWQFIPFHTLLYAVGRRQIPVVLYEAARIDGANPAQMFFRVTLPQLRYTIVTSGILMIVGALTYFDIIYIMNPAGGPGTSTRVLSLDMYLAAFQSDQFGYASVLATILGVIGIAIAMIMVRFSGFGRMQSQQEGVA